jgi:RNA polymerase I-specific transcription initiation factor RRN6
MISSTLQFLQMADFSVYDLNYGHPGEPFYDLENRKWEFKRIPTLSRVWMVLEDSSDSASPSEQPLTPEPDQLNETSRQAKQRVHKFVSQDVQLSTLENLIRPYEQFSKLIIDVTATFDPAISDLLVLGNAFDVENKKTVQVLASPCGTSGESLRIVRLITEKRSWENQSDIWLDSPNLGGEIGFWSGLGAPIQQLCSSPAKYSSSLLAIRLAREIIIFRPLLGQEVIPAAGSQTQALPPSVLHANPIGTIPAQTTVLVDITFNPWYSRQLGLIEESGHWSIWEISWRQKSARITFCPKKLCTGQLRDKIYGQEQLSSEKAYIVGGWARICWFGNVHTIVVCSRRTIQVCSLTADNHISKFPRLLSDKESDWILDVRLLPTRPNFLLVLTTSKLFVVQATASSELDDTLAHEITIALSWRHYCEPGDITLSMQVNFLEHGKL